MTTSMAADTSRGRRTAQIVTELTSPTVLAPALLVVVAVKTQLNERHQAVLWGLVAAIFVGAVPLVFLKLGVRRGRWADHHVSERASRAAPLIFAGCSVAVGIGLLLAGHAPHAITALVIAMLVGLISVLVISRWWKVSIHSAVAGGTAVILSAVFGTPGLVIGLVLALAAGCSRLVPRDHTILQVIVGLIVGAAAALLYLPLR
jgi:membrane-associated phospholipid phosphatase